MGSSYYDQMRKQEATSSSKLSTSSHHNMTTGTNNSNSRSIATNTAKVLNKINTLVRPPESFLKSRPHPRRPPPPPPPPPPELFQMVHTPDRASPVIPMWDIPRTDTEVRAALKKMKMQDQQREEGGGWGHRAGEAVKGVAGGPYDRVPSSNRCVEDFLGVQPKDPLRGKGMITNLHPGRTPANPRTDYGSLKSVPSMHSFRLDKTTFERPRGGLTTSSSTPMVSTPTSARFPSRVMSVEALRAPRPLSERALIPLVPRAGRSEQVPERAMNSSSTLVASPAVMPRSSSGGNIMQGAVTGRTAVDPGIRTRGRRTRRVRSIDSISANDGELTDGGDGNKRHGGRSARQTRAWHETEHFKDSPGAVGRVTMCYVCQEPCKSGAGLCNECKARFQPLGEVFEDSESEYEDEPVDVPHPPPKQSLPVTPAPPPRSDRRGDSISLQAEAEDTSSRGSSGQSSASKRLREMASRSTSVSPTPHLAHNIQLKVVPYPMIRKVSVSSPAREREDHRRSALYHIQQTMKPREPLTPGADPDEGRDAIRVGSVHSGEVRLIDEHTDEPDERLVQQQQQQQQQQHGSGSSYGDWFRYYEKVKKDGETGEYVSEHYELVSPSPITNSELFRSHRDRESARSSTYDLIYSIYNDYCDEQDDVEYGGMF